MTTKDYIIISFHDHHEAIRYCRRGCCPPNHLGEVHAELVVQRVSSEEEAVNHIARLNHRLQSMEHHGGLSWEHRAIWAEHFSPEALAQGWSDRHQDPYLIGDDFSLPRGWEDMIRALERELTTGVSR